MVLKFNFPVFPSNHNVIEKIRLNFYSRFPETETFSVLSTKYFSKFQEEELKGAILVVLANKQDIEGAMSVTEVHQALGLEALKNRTFQIFKASAIKGDGLDESMEWLSNALQNRK